MWARRRKVVASHNVTPEIGPCALAKTRPDSTGQTTANLRPVVKQPPVVSATHCSCNFPPAVPAVTHEGHKTIYVETQRKPGNECLHYFTRATPTEVVGPSSSGCKTHISFGVSTQPTQGVRLKSGAVLASLQTMDTSGLLLLLNPHAAKNPLDRRRSCASLIRHTKHRANATLSAVLNSRDPPFIFHFQPNTHDNSVLG